MEDVRSKTWPVATIAGLGMAAIWLFLAGIVGAIKVGGADDAEVATGGPASTSSAGGLEPDADFVPFGAEESDGAPDGGAPITPTAPGDPAAPADPAAPVDPGSTPAPNTGSSGTTPTTSPAGGGGGNSGGGGGSAAAPSTTAAPAPSTTAAPAVGDRTGVSDTSIKIGIHAPESIGGAPLNLAEDPIKGIEGYTEFINQNGGIHGRMLELDIQDDRYETSGGAAAARALIENGNFIISGTLGVDQINVVANEAAKAGIPYHAAGGDEAGFAKLGLYQISTSYDTHAIQLARWLAQDADLQGKKVGISSLNTPLIKNTVEIFRAEANRVGVDLVEVVYIEKPTDQSSYTAEIQRLKDAGVELFVPFQDPVSTSRMVNECLAALCTWDYTFSNFAHEGDTALTLFGGEWGRRGVKGLAGGCYFLAENAYDPNFCGAMNKAHDQWVAIYGEDDWQENGQGGATGYQIVSMLAEGLRRVGPDLTRERYAAAIRTLDNYDDLITSPISFAGKSTFSHGSEKMVVYQAQTNDKYAQITPGFVEF